MNGASVGRPVTPALLTRMSIRPQVSMVRATALWHPSAVAKIGTHRNNRSVRCVQRFRQFLSQLLVLMADDDAGTVRQEALANRRPDPRAAARHQGDPTGRWARQGSQLTVASSLVLLVV